MAIGMCLGMCIGTVFSLAGIVPLSYGVSLGMLIGMVAGECALRKNKFRPSKRVDLHVIDILRSCGASPLAMII